MTINLAGCVIENSEKKILLIHRNTPKRTQWELPGGKIEEGEDAQKAAIREVSEEINITIEVVEKLGEAGFKEDSFDMNYTWFLAKITSGVVELQEDKFDEFSYFSWEELGHMQEKLSANVSNLRNAYVSHTINL